MAAKDRVFTVNNYTDKEYNALMAKYDVENVQIWYIVVGKEVERVARLTFNI